MELMSNLFAACASVVLVTWYTTDRFQFTPTIVYFYYRETWSLMGRV